MKLSYFVAFLFITFSSYAQHIKQIEQDLISAFQKIDYWKQMYYSSRNDTTYYDSLGKANDDFGRLLLKYTTNNEETLKYDFKNLVDNGVRIITSEDGRFRIYSWYTKTGKTTDNWEHIFQYKCSEKVYSKIVGIENSEDSVVEGSGCIYYKINDLVSENKKFYMVQSASRLASSYYYSIQIFSIDKNGLNDKVKLIKTKNRITDHLGYEIDLSLSINQGMDNMDISIVYDKKSKSFTFPLIYDNFKISHKRIKYKFTGKYFEKQ